MKVKKNASGGLLKPEPRPKRTRQGDGTRSKPSHGRKLSRGQGK